MSCYEEVAHAADYAIPSRSIHCIVGYSEPCRWTHRDLHAGQYSGGRDASESRSMVDVVLGWLWWMVWSHHRVYSHPNYALHSACARRGMLFRSSPNYYGSNV